MQARLQSPDPQARYNISSESSKVSLLCRGLVGSTLILLPLSPYFGYSHSTNLYQSPTQLHRHHPTLTDAYAAVTPCARFVSAACAPCKLAHDSFLIHSLSFSLSFHLIPILRSLPFPTWCRHYPSLQTLVCVLSLAIKSTSHSFHRA